MLERATALLTAHEDVLTARPAGGEVPEALARRGWDSFLLALDDHQLDVVEQRGLDAEWPSGAPETLSAMTREARAVVDVPAIDASAQRRSARRLETPRKRAQVDAFAEVILPLARDAARVIDVGSGHGHLTRELAARIDRPVIGVERDARLIERARALSPDVSFAITDVLRDGLALGERDCVIGLHACGELGDAMVERAAMSGASLALVGCCLQKRRATSRASFTTNWAIATRVLGLSNLAPGDVGVEATRRENLLARERRLALHALLEARSGPLRHGAEIDGLNRRVAHAPLEELVRRAFAVRSLPLPSSREVEDAARSARERHARARRLSLPRNMLARPLEVYVALDRAAHLARHGSTAEVCVAFDRAISARNLVVVARRP